jgi:activator of HSP90 ATPase
MKSLTRWGYARMDFIKQDNGLLSQFTDAELHQHCLEVEAQAEMRKRNMMAAIRKDPANKVTEKDKASDPMVWVQKMNAFQASVHEIIYNDLIFSQ